MGLIENWVKETMTNATKCDSIPKVVASHKRTVTSLGLSQVGSFFMLVIGGLILSVLGHLAEIVWNKCKLSKTPSKHSIEASEEKNRVARGDKIWKDIILPFHEETEEAILDLVDI